VESRRKSVGYDGTIRFWDAQARLLDTSSSFGLPLRHVTWSPDGTRIAVAGEPSIVHIWDVTNKRVSETLVLLPDQHWLRVSPHGQILTPSPAAMAHVAYVVEAEDRSLKLLTFDEFQSRMGLTGTAAAP
jgi:WD40 repeat protein